MHCLCLYKALFKRKSENLLGGREPVEQQRISWGGGLENRRGSRETAVGRKLAGGKFYAPGPSFLELLTMNQKL